MPVYRGYNVDSLGVSIAGTSATPLLYMATTSTNDANILRINVAIDAASSPAPPSNGSVLFQLAKVTGTVGGGGAVTPQITGPSSLAANTTFSSANAGALTGLTQGVSLWEAEIPFTAGAWKEDAYENTGLEINLGASGKWCIYFTAASGAGSGCNARAQLWFAE